MAVPTTPGTPPGSPAQRRRSSMRRVLRVLIVDDHAPFRALARRVLARAGYDVVGEAADGAGARQAVDRLRPDVVLLDVHLPDADGAELAAVLRVGEDRPVVLLTSSRDPLDLEPVLRRSAARGL